MKFFVYFLLVLSSCLCGGLKAAHAQTRLTVTRDDPSATLTLRAGPVKLASGAAAQVGPLVFQQESAGSATSFRVRLADERRAELPGRLLRQLVLENTARQDIVCAGHAERLLMAFTAPFGLPEFPGTGFAVEAGDKLRVSATVNNDGAQDYDSIFVEITVGFRERAKSPYPITRLIPAWMDARGCAGRLTIADSVLRQEYTFPGNGKLLAAAGDAVPTGKRLLLEKLPGSVLAELIRPPSGPFGVVNWMPRGGIAVSARDKFRITAEFNNPLPDSAGKPAAALLLYFLPLSTQ